MKRFNLTLFALAIAVVPFTPVLVSADGKSEWWWRVIEWIMLNGGSWNLW